MCCCDRIIRKGFYMDVLEILLIGIGLSMDAAAVSMSNGMVYRDLKNSHYLAMILAFGFFQGLMPVLGFWAGSAVSAFIQRIDHWIALILLGYLGGRMLWDAYDQWKDPQLSCPVESFSYQRLLVQAVATSIDALAVGITLAALSVNILAAAAFIGVVTFVCCLAGVYLGCRFGMLLQSWAGFFGGGILVAIGLKIFLEHTLGG